MFGITGLRPKQDHPALDGKPGAVRNGRPLGAAAGCASPADSGGETVAKRGPGASGAVARRRLQTRRACRGGADTRGTKVLCTANASRPLPSGPRAGAGCDRAGAPTQAAVPPSRYGPRSGFVPALHWFRPDINSNPLGILNCFLRQAIAGNPRRDVENLGSCVKTGHDLWLFQKRISARGQNPKSPRQPQRCRGRPSIRNRPLAFGVPKVSTICSSSPMRPARPDTALADSRMPAAMRPVMRLTSSSERLICSLPRTAPRRPWRCPPPGTRSSPPGPRSP